MVSIVPYVCNFFSHNPIGKRIIDASVLFITCTACLGIYWGLIDIDSPITSIERKMVDPPTENVMVGQTVTIVGKICSTRTVPQLEISRSFVDGVIFMIPTGSDENRVIPAGCYEFKRKLRIPNNLPPGTYNQHTDVTVRINPLRTIKFEAPNIKMVVTRPDGWQPGSD